MSNKDFATDILTATAPLSEEQMEIEELDKMVGGKRLHISKSPITELRFPYHTKDHEERKFMIGKPAGLWWGVGTAWLKWCESEMPEWLWPYLYEVTPPERFLKIATLNEYEQFKKEYVTHKPIPHSSTWVLPKWGDVADNFDGIEINPYRYHRRLEDMWYYGWDCASGCAWRGASVKLIGMRSADGYELINEG